MSVRLKWRTARKGDRRLLQSFTCTVDRPRNWREPHPRPWELQVQSWVRELKPPVHGRRSVDLGFAGPELAAVVVVDHVEEEFFHIPAVARALDRRGAATGTGIVDHAIDLAAARASPDLDHIILSANIHRRNSASRQCFERAGFTRDIGMTDPSFEQWLLRVEFDVV
ncbi:hypothetical protein [Leifsonia virtsii]|uniref:N-acetyltransferase domain-containing protein n=1 Tax=Leifsonia virtsii TaxID=3035915 RepID=A0ABT8IZ46_9MICO|nr:hypothetical protein [Leifsonia virtsii]MDN4598074.1 hypothetical protein [Leifsonia virtsii]